MPKAYAIDGTIDDTTCTPTFGGVWDGVDTCTITTNITVNQTLTIPSGVNLVVANNNNTTVGIYNFGTIDNSGTMTVSNSVIGSYGIQNFGTITNSGTLILSNNGEGFGILNVNSTITNSGTINVQNSGDSSTGIDNFGDLATFTNSGTITVSSGGSLGEPVTGIANSGILTNSGTLTVSNTGAHSQGILNIGVIFSFPTFTNSGTLTVSNTGGIGLYNFGSLATITNDGTITVSNTGGIGIRNSVGSGGVTNTNSGTLTVSNTGGTGLHNIGPSSPITNSGTLAVSNTGGVGILNEGTISNPGTINNYCGTIINLGSMTGNPVNDLCDSDNDGISDNVDTQPNTFSNDFSDKINGTTTGTIITRGNQTLRIFEAPNPDGVEIMTEPAGNGIAAEIIACAGAAVYSLSAGSDIIVTCGSVTTQVIQGPAEVEFIGTDGSTAFASIEAGNTLTFDPDTFSFEAPESNASPINIVIGGNTVVVDPGETVQQLSVSIDIKPGGTPNTINIKKDKIVTVALLGTSTFNVDSVDTSALRFGGHTLHLASKTSLQDVNKDSLVDLVMQFKVPALDFEVSDTEGCLTGLLQDGTPIIGCDSVRILDK